MTYSDKILCFGWLYLIIKDNQDYFEGVSQDTWTTVPMQGSGTFSVEAVFQTAIPKQGKVKHSNIV